MKKNNPEQPKLFRGSTKRGRPGLNQGWPNKTH